MTVVNLDTNFTFTALTNSEGLYRVPSLQPGPYRITFKAVGFKQLVRNGVMLRTGDVLAVNANLEVGALTESIAVTASAELVESQTASAGAVLEGHTVLLANWDLADIVGVAHFTSILLDCGVIGIARLHAVCFSNPGGIAD